jgi:imidazolonepropionase-like amidohydrolase
MVQYGDMAVVDGVPEVLKATREALRRGASQIKIAVGGGTGSYADPLDVVEFTPEEIRAAVQAVADWGTYVMAHVYNSEGIRRAVDNGVKSIEHGNLIDEATLRYMQEKDVWLSPQVIVYTFIWAKDVQKTVEPALEVRSLRHLEPGLCVTIAPRRTEGVKGLACAACEDEDALADGMGDLPLLKGAVLHRRQP